MNKLAVAARPYFGYYEESHLALPVVDPGLNALCPYCGKPLKGQAVTKRIMQWPSTVIRVFYRVHEACEAGATQEEQASVQDMLLDILTAVTPIEPGATVRGTKASLVEGELLSYEKEVVEPTSPDNQERTAWVARTLAHEVVRCLTCGVTLEWRFSHAHNGYFNAYAEHCGHRYQGWVPTEPLYRELHVFAVPDQLVEPINSTAEGE